MGSRVGLGSDGTPMGPMVGIASLGTAVGSLVGVGDWWLVDWVVVGIGTSKCVYRTANARRNDRESTCR